MSQHSKPSAIKEVTVFTNGDAAKISTWSNVPYFFTETLLQKGIRVNRVNICPPFLLRGLYKVFVFPVLKFLGKNSTYTFYRTGLNFLIQRFRIKQALKQYPDAQANIFLNFSFSSAGLSKQPTVLFGDWTYDHYFRYFEERKPGRLELSSIRREDAQIEQADLVFPLFPGVAGYMQQHYKNRHIHYLGNVVNTLTEADAAEILPLKRASTDLLFVGSSKYMKGANTLIAAFVLLKKEFPELRLHIIGMQQDDFPSLPDGVQCHGYLDKANAAQQELYYRLLKKARVFINPHPKWGAFSASIEAMYFYTPVIVTPYEEFTATFGGAIGFGYYCREELPEALAASIREVLTTAGYETMCRNAHEAVKAFTWSSYIDKILEHLEKLPNLKV